MSGESYPFVELTLRPGSEDLAAALLLGLGATGLESRDETTLVTAPAGSTLLIGFFEDVGDARAAAEEARARLGDGCVDARVDVAEDPGWRLAWRDYFKPMRFGGGLWVAPPDEQPALAKGEQLLTLVPSTAFGAGTHETTSLILDLLADLVAPGCAVLDVGCGSGILALAALRLGAGRARGVDVDPDAVEAAQGNARSNRLASRSTFSDTPLERIRGRYDLVLANLSRAELPALVEPLAARVAPKGHLVWSGILAQEADEIPPPPGLERRSRHSRGEWVAEVYTRNSGPPR